MSLKLKHIFISVLAFFLFGTCKAQEDHLEPSEFKSPASSVELYYKNMLPLLNKGFKERPYARYTFIPSFQVEHAFSVEETDGSYSIVSHWFSKSYWYTKDKTRVRQRMFSVEIDEHFYKMIGELFNLVVQQSHKYEKKELGDDGEDYYFSITDNSGNIKTGTIWSPPEGTKMLRLTEICEEIYKMGEGLDISVDKTETEIKQLKADLKGK
jgi:hypothetical protein